MVITVSFKRLFLYINFKFRPCNSLVSTLDSKHIADFCGLIRMLRVHEVWATAVDDPGHLSVCHAASLYKNGSTSCLGWRLLGNQETVYPDGEGEGR